MSLPIRENVVPLWELGGYLGRRLPRATEKQEPLKVQLVVADGYAEVVIEPRTLEPQKIRLMTIEQFSKAYFDPQSTPPMRSVRTWCEQGMLPATKIGRLWFIDANEFERSFHLDDLVKAALKDVE